MLIKYPPPMIKRRASVRIGPHRLEIDLPQELGNRPPAAQKGDAFSPQPSTMKDAFLFWVDHGSRPDVRLGAGRPVSRYADREGRADWPVPSLMHRRRVLANCITYVGLDVDKEGIVVAVAEGGPLGEIREYGRIANTAAALNRLLSKLRGEGVRLRFCYEAGRWGHGIQRHLSGYGHQCVVVAPPLIRRRAGDRVKTDRRDAASLARLHRAGELTAVWVPDVGQRWNPPLPENREKI